MRGEEETLTWRAWGTPTAKGGIPAPLIDVAHRACVLWEGEEHVALSEFLARALRGRDGSFWSEILPEGDKQKQILQALLASQDRLQACRQKRLL